MRESLEQSKRQAQDIASLSSQLQAAQRERYFNPFTYFLGLLALFALGLSVWLWRRQGDSDRPWWRGASSSQRDEREEQHWSRLNQEMMQDVDVGLVDPAKPIDSAAARLERAERALGAGSSSSTAALKPVGAQSSDLGGLTVKMLPSVGAAQGARPVPGMARFEETKPPATPSAPRTPSKAPVLPDRNMGYSDFANSNFASSRLVSTEELFDIQEQADFFMSLDQPEQAIAVLKNHITDNVETSALAYMDLFDIYHRTGREDDYQELREEFNRVFNAQVPEFAHYSDQSLGLEEYPQAIAAIEQAWPRPQEALELIEEYIFRQPDPQQSPFDMLAYRELMLMYAMTKDLVKTQSAESMLPTISALKEAISGGAASGPDLDLSSELDRFVSAQGDAGPVEAGEKDSADRDDSVSADFDAPRHDRDLPGLDFDLSDVDVSSPASGKTDKNSPAG
jgi:tetratricopeptide (TPR) repeat protein